MSKEVKVDQVPKKGRPPAGPPKRRSASICVYFPDESKVEEVKALLDQKFPRSSLSSVLAQFLDPVLDALRQMETSDRVMKINSSIYV